MSSYEVPEPIINSPFDEPKQHWHIEELTPAERGGKRANPKPEAILKYAHHPIAMLGALWDATREEWKKRGSDPPSAGLHFGLQKHATCERRVRLARE